MAKKRAQKSAAKTPQSEKKAVPISVEMLRKFSSDLADISQTLRSYADEMESLGIQDVKDFVKGIMNGIAAADNWSQNFTTALSKAVREKGGKIELKITPPTKHNGAA